MNSLHMLWVGLGGGLGAIVRYGVGVLFQTTSEEIKFPWSTLTVNLIGCFIIGVVWQYLSKNANVNAFWLIGVLGGFTTFSSFGLDGLKLFNAGAFTQLTTYVLISNIVGLLLVFIGTKVADLTLT
ncbi:MAG: CrcB protein [Bacteroidia bacterium]|jgi:CrcB protein